MITRRFLNHLKQQHWTGVLIELVIVVLGVFIGLQASNWNQARQEQARSRRVTRDLVTDLAGIQKQADLYIDGYGRQMQSLERVIAFFESDAAAPADRQQFEKDLNNMMGGAPPISRSATMVELLSSGETGLIRDESLRHALIKLDQRIQIAAKLNAGLNSVFMTYNVRINDLAWPNFRFSDKSHTITGVKNVNYNLAKMRADPQLLPALSALLGLDNAEVMYRRGIRDAAAGLHKRLEAAE